jgi:hypothetical protein
LGLRGTRYQGNGENYIMRSLMIYTPHPLVQRWAGHVARMGMGEAFVGFWWGNLRERDHLGDPGLDGRIILKWIFKKWNVGVWTGLIWLRIEIGGEHL